MVEVSFCKDWHVWKITVLSSYQGLLCVTAYSAPYAVYGLQQDVQGIGMEICRALFLMKCIYWAKFGRISALVWLKTSRDAKL